MINLARNHYVDYMTSTSFGKSLKIWQNVSFTTNQRSEEQLKLIKTWSTVLSCNDQNVRIASALLTKRSHPHRWKISNYKRQCYTKQQCRHQQKMLIPWRQQETANLLYILDDVIIIARALFGITVETKSQHQNSQEV